jgi:hypothetical protein
MWSFFTISFGTETFYFTNRKNILKSKFVSSYYYCIWIRDPDPQKSLNLDPVWIHRPGSNVYRHLPYSKAIFEVLLKFKKLPRTVKCTYLAAYGKIACFGHLHNNAYHTGIQKHKFLLEIGKSAK